MYEVLINYMAKIGNISVGGRNPVRIMSILNTSPESFYKKSINTTRIKIKDTVIQMENDGADIIDVGGMSTAPYLSTTVSKKVESSRILNAIKIIQDNTNLPISVDTCRSSVAKNALQNDVEIINDISGLKYDEKMKDVISKFQPSVILCAYGSKTISGNAINSTKKLLKDSLKIIKKCNISDKKIVLDPAIGFFRKTGKGKFFTKIKTDWVTRDLSVIKNLNSIKMNYPILISVSNKSIIGNLLEKENPSDRLFGSITAEAICAFKWSPILFVHIM